MTRELLTTRDNTDTESPAVVEKQAQLTGDETKMICVADSPLYPEDSERQSAATAFLDALRRSEKARSPSLTSSDDESSEREEEEEESNPSSSSTEENSTESKPSRATSLHSSTSGPESLPSSRTEEEVLSDTTGHSPIGSKLRRLIQHDQTIQRRKLFKRLHPLKESSMSIPRNRKMTTPRSTTRSLASESNRLDSALASTVATEASDAPLSNVSSLSLECAILTAQDVEEIKSAKEVTPPRASNVVSLRGQANSKAPSAPVLVSKKRPVLAPSKAGPKKIVTPVSSGAKSPPTALRNKKTPAPPKNILNRGHQSVPLTSTTLPVRRNSTSSKENEVTQDSLQFLAPGLQTEDERRRTVTIVFDLDETLVNNRTHGHTIFRPHAMGILKELRSTNPHPLYTSVKVNRMYDLANSKLKVPLSRARRYSTTTTSEASERTPPDDRELRVELILWTASVEMVARPVVHKLDPDRSIFDHVIYRDFRWYKEVDYTKDLSKLGRDMDRVVIIENSPASVSLNPQNAIIVTDYVHGSRDRELMWVEKVLKEWMAAVRQQLKGAERSLDTRESTLKETTESADAVVSSTEAASMGEEVRTDSIVSHFDPNASLCSKESTTPAESRCRSISKSVPRSTSESKEPQPLPVDVEYFDNIRVFLSKHPYITPETNHINPPKISALDISSQTLTATSKAHGTQKSGEPVWKRLYALSTREGKESNAATEDAAKPRKSGQLTSVISELKLTQRKKSRKKVHKPDQQSEGGGDKPRPKKKGKVTAASNVGREASCGSTA